MTKILSTKVDCVSVSWVWERRQLTIRIKTVMCDEYVFTSENTSFKSTLTLLDAACAFRTALNGFDSTSVHQTALSLIQGKQ